MKKKRMVWFAAPAASAASRAFAASAALAASALLLLWAPGCGDKKASDQDGGADAGLDAGWDATADGSADGGDGGVADRFVTYVARHYDFTLDLATRAATAVVRFEVQSPGDCVRIGFRPPVADNVLLDGTAALDVNVVQDRLEACDGTGVGWDASDLVELSVDCTVPEETWDFSQVGFSIRLDDLWNPFTYLLSWVGGCDRHGPCDARAGTFATYTFRVTHEQGTQVLCPGEVTAGTTQTTCSFTWAGGPTYSTFALMASPSWQTADLGSFSGVAATLYDIPGSAVGQAFPTQAASGFVAWMISTFGSWPYGNKLRFVIAPTYWSGFEHPGNIVLNEELSASGAVHVVIHELAHMWAGNLTTLADTYDFVWKEAMCEYLSFVYEDEQIDPAEAADTAYSWKVWSQGAGYFPVPDERPPLLDYYGEVYGPGPMIFFRQLEVMYGRPAMIAALQSVLGVERTLSVEQLRDALQTATGVSLTTYFDGWVFGTNSPAWPRADVSVTDVGGGNVQVGVTLSTADSVPRGCRFNVQLAGGAGQSYDVDFDFGVNMTPVSPQTVNPGFAVTGYVLDPYHECLVYDANRSPRAYLPRPLEPWRVPGMF